MTFERILIVVLVLAVLYLVWSRLRRGNEESAKHSEAIPPPSSPRLQIDATAGNGSVVVTPLPPPVLAPNVELLR